MSKRSRTEARTSDCVCIDVGGTSIKTSRSTLLACAYFARALSEEWSYDSVDAGADAQLFIDRDAALFRWVLTFLRSGALPQLPPFAAEKGLWRALRQEADFLGCDSLRSYLDVTQRLRFDYTGDTNGVLHWLGCDRGFSEPLAAHVRSGVLDTPN